MILMKIDTSLLEKFSSILVLIVLICMVASVMRFLLSKNTIGAIVSIGICGVLLWAVSSPDNLMAFVNTIVVFIKNVVTI